MNNKTTQKVKLAVLATLFILTNTYNAYAYSYDTKKAIIGDNEILVTEYSPSYGDGKDGFNGIFYNKKTGLLGYGGFDESGNLGTVTYFTSVIGGAAYSAGSDISISSANIISVNKTGTIASGNTGIITGGAVYKTV